ncbi:hypothetical protein BFJ69_g17766, partial [Fusarium oxysporum]
SDGSPARGGPAIRNEPKEPLAGSRASKGDEADGGGGLGFGAEPVEASGRQEVAPTLATAARDAHGARAYMWQAPRQRARADNAAALRLVAANTEHIRIG